MFPEDVRALRRTPVQGYDRRPAPCIHHYYGNRLMSNERGKEFPDVRDPTQATFMYIKNWQLGKHVKPPGMRGEGGG